jgi:uracil-DNA glycosylase family 4
MTSREYKEELLKELYAPYQNCKECHLGYKERKNVVFGEGNPDAELLFIGEGPGKEEDEQGRPFVGRSGQLLNRVLAQVDIQRSDVFITNIVKCRPPNNRAPTPQEATTCMNIFLFNQIKIIRPKIICPLGSIALNSLIGKPCSITQLRGKTLQWEEFLLMPTYHPAYILRNQSQALTWLEDFKGIKNALSKGE